MNRVVKAAVAVTAFGLAAALAAPAQADLRNDVLSRSTDVPLLGASPAGGFVQSMLASAYVNGLLVGVSHAKSAGAGSDLTAVQRDMYMERRAQMDWRSQVNRPGQINRGFTPNAEEDVTRETWPMPEISPIVAGTPFGGQGMSASVPSTRSVKRGRSVSVGQDAPPMQGVPLPGTVTSVGDAHNLPGRGVVPGLGTAARMALPDLAAGMVTSLPAQAAAVADQVETSERIRSLKASGTANGLTPLANKATGKMSNGTVTMSGSTEALKALGWTADTVTGTVAGQAED
ncbi:hypothetical protein [Nonomuraea maritima]|uniref:hypothetical protein n=1 Tax=Nonomuraea maritima TaxID=683260 RepID=UPI00371F7C0A